MNPFLEACGATGPLMLTVEAPGQPAGDAHVFEQPFVLIGRDSRCDLRLNHPEVSDRHAYLQLVAGRLVCLDLGSRNGVYQGGRRGRLIDVDRDRPIRIGPYRIRLIAGDQDAPAPSSLATDRTTDVLELSHRGLRQSRCDLPPGLALAGSSGDCPIRLIDPSVSTYHASFVQGAAGVWVVDLLGDDGVRVNGHVVSFARLGQGDSVELGHSVIRLSSVPRPTAAAVVAEANAFPEAPTPEPFREPAPPVKALPLALTELEDALPVAPCVSANLGHDAEERRPIAQAAEIVEQVLTPVVNQVSLMQQQMIEEFHQARETMFEMFASLHHEQSAFFNRELEQLRQLGRDMHVLQADLERQTRALAERLDRARAPAPASVSAPATATTVTAVAPAPVAPSPTARLGSAASAELRSAGSAASAPTRIVSRPVAVPTGPVSFNGSTARQSRPELPALRDAVPAATDLALDSDRYLQHGRRPIEFDENIHAQLCERIARIEDDHQSRWQKILGLFQPAPQRKPAS